MSHRLVFLVLLVTAACGGGARAVPDQTAGKAAPPAQEEIAGMFEELSRQLEAQGGDCDALADALGAWTQRHGARYAELSGDVDADSLRPYQDRIERSLAVVVQSVDACGESERARSAFEAFDRLIEHGQ